MCADATGFRGTTGGTPPSTSASGAAATTIDARTHTRTIAGGRVSGGSFTLATRHKTTTVNAGRTFRVAAKPFG